MFRGKKQYHNSRILKKQLHVHVSSRLQFVYSDLCHVPLDGDLIFVNINASIANILQNATTGYKFCNMKYKVFRQTLHLQHGFHQRHKHKTSPIKICLRKPLRGIVTLCYFPYACVASEKQALITSLNFMLTHQTRY